MPPCKGCACAKGTEKLEGDVVGGFLSQEMMRKRV